MKKIQTREFEVNNEHGFESYRVPGIIVSSTGNLLLSYEGRNDNGKTRTLFIRRISCNGNDLGTRIALATTQGNELLHNPMLLACNSGRILAFWCQDYSRLFLRESFDDGVTFGQTRELTNVIGTFRKDWPVTLWALSPGHGIAMSDGTLVVPLWMSKGDNAHLPACFACIYSRDGGASWRCSNIVSAGNGVGDPTEASVAERSDGTLLATMRHEIRGTRQRAFCAGGPDRWGKAYLDWNLPDPICAGAVLRIEGKRLAFVNCAYGDEPALEMQRQGKDIRWSMNARQNLTLRISNDDGKTWSEGLLLEHEGGASDLGLSRDKTKIYCVYEKGWADGNCIYNRALALSVISLD